MLKTQYLGLTFRASQRVGCIQAECVRFAHVTLLSGYVSFTQTCSGAGA